MFDEAINMPKEKVKIAICGGGITSLCLVHALTKYPHLDVKIFEKSTVLREEGAAVGLGPNAQNALAQISPELRDAVDEAGGVSMDPPLRLRFAETGQHITDVRLEMTQIVTYWGRLYKALYRRIPGGVLHLGKGAVRIESLQENGHASVYFEDGTSYEADVVVGCDGINSVVRTAILGVDHPAVTAVYTDRYNHRVVVPIEEAKAVFGEEYCSVVTQHGWIGPNTFLLTDQTSNGEAMQVIADFALDQPWPYPSPFVEYPKEKMRESLAKCGDIGKAITKIYEAQPKLYAACLRRHLDTPFFCKDNICIAGDAALAFLPFHGAGAGQAIEDALILSAVLSAISTPQDVPRALKIYDEIRRPRRHHVAEKSDWAAQVLTGTHPEYGMDRELLAANVANWGSSIYGYDCAAAQRDALNRMSDGIDE